MSPTFGEIGLLDLDASQDLENRGAGNHVNQGRDSFGIPKETCPQLQYCILKTRGVWLEFVGTLSKLHVISGIWCSDRRDCVSVMQLPRALELESLLHIDDTIQLVLTISVFARFALRRRRGAGAGRPGRAAVPLRA